MATDIERQLERKKLYEDWARITSERLLKSIRKKGIGYSNHLFYSLHHLLQAVSGGDISSIKHGFDVSGKFVDMGVGRGQKIEDVKTNADLISLLGQGRKPKKWLSKRYFSEVQELESLIAEKYGEQYQGVIKEIIELNSAS